MQVMRQLDSDDGPSLEGRSAADNTTSNDFAFGPTISLATMTPTSFILRTASGSSEPFVGWENCLMVLGKFWNRIGPGRNPKH